MYQLFFDPQYFMLTVSKFWEAALTASLIPFGAEGSKLNHPPPDISTSDPFNVEELPK